MGLRHSARFLVPAAVIPLLLAVVLFAPATLGGNVLSASDAPLFQAPFLTEVPGTGPENPLQYDSAFVFEPDGLEVRDAFREGRLPVWSQALAGGRPLLAAQQSAPFFPLTWLSTAFPFWESLAWIAVLKLAIAGLGGVLLARALGLGLAPALIAGVSYAFGTYLIDWLMHPHANAYVLLPWTFLLASRLWRTGAVRDAALLGGVLGVAYLGGQPESSLLVSLATVAWGVYLLASERRPRRDAALRVALGAGAVVLGGAIAAVMLVPFVEALGQSYATSRSGDPMEAKAGLSLFFPEYWGRPDRAPTPYGPLNFTERTLYVGALPILLAVAGLFARRPRGPQLFFAGLAVVALAVALDSGPFTDAVRAIPGLDVANLDRSLVLVSFALAMLAGFGVQRFVVGSAAERRRMLIAAGVTSVVPVLAVVGMHPSWLGDLKVGAKRMLGRATPLDPEVIAVASVLRWLVFAVAAIALLAALLRWRGRAELVALAMVGLVAIDLLVMGWGYNPAIPKSEADPAAPPAVGLMRQMTADGARVVGINALEPNTASRWDLRDARGHEQPVVERTERLWQSLGGGSTGATAAVAPEDPSAGKLLDLFGVKAIVVDPAMVEGSKAPAGPLRRDPIVYERPDAVVLEHRSALPPAFVAYGWRRTPGLTESIFALALTPSRMALNQPLIETDEAPPPGEPPPATPARIVSRSDTEVTVSVSARSAGQLVLLDTFYPGWNVEVDGRDASIYPANAAFRAVPVAAGRHTVRFSYKPASVVAGAVISLVALVALAGLLLLTRRRRGPREAVEQRTATAAPAGR